MIISRVSFLPKENFNIELFKEALSKFLGKHDFRNFTSKEEDIDDYLRDIRRAELIDKGNGLYSVFLESNGFMRYMVRMIIGTCFKIAYGKLDISIIDELFSRKEKHAINYKAEPDGLYLVEVKYVSY